MIKPDFYTEPVRAIKEDAPTMLIDGDMICHMVANAANGWSYRVLDGRTRPVFPSALEANNYLLQLGLSKELWRERLAIPESLENTLHSVRLTLEFIFESCNFGPAIIFISGTDNFRYKISKDYKANRSNYVAPYHLQNCKDYLIKRYDAIVVDGMEADDAIGIAATQQPYSIICSLDKDLDMIPGRHYKWPFNNQAGYKYKINEVEALRCFYTQLITGDPTDNIEGLSEKAPKKRTFPTKPIEAMESEEEMKEYVLTGYKLKYGREAEEAMEKMGQLLWILREEGKVWRLSK
jgi:hypothetical protein